MVRFTLDVDGVDFLQNDGTPTVESETVEVLVDDLVEEFEITRRRPLVA